MKSLFISIISGLNFISSSNDSSGSISHSSNYKANHKMENSIKYQQLLNKSQKSLIFFIIIQISPWGD